MKIVHTSDWHLGKKINGFSMLEDQIYILKQLEEMILLQKADILIIAGDIYDRSVPPEEAVAVLNDFLGRIIRAGVTVLMITGNHDSAERLSFANRLLERQGLYIAGTFHGTVKKVTKEDKFGPVNFYLLPFVKSAVVKYYYEESEIFSFEDAVKILIEKMEINKKERNVLVTHHFVTNAGKGPELSDSETVISVGGADNVDCSLFDDFDYTALGHIHKPQWVGNERIRYAGSILKYSFSEVNQKKGAAIVDLKEKGNLQITSAEFHPLHDMRKIKGRLLELIAEDVLCMADKEDYIQAVITDQEDFIDPMGKLKNSYPNIMQLILEKNIKAKQGKKVTGLKKIKQSPLELFEDFYQKAAGRELDETRKQIIRQVISETEKEIYL